MSDVCKHCDEPVMLFTFAEVGEQWWHANPGASPGTYLRCRIGANFAEPGKRGDR